MRRTVERILKGQFDYEKGSLDLSLSRIELTLAPGEIYTGSFFIKAVRGRLTEGRIYSSDIRMELIVDSFSGLESEIGYTFSAQGLEEGDVAQGEFSIISNQGEYYQESFPFHQSCQVRLGRGSQAILLGRFHQSFRR